MNHLESPLKRRRLDTITDKSHFYNDYDDKIYVTGGTEVHFTANVNDDTIEKLKRLMSEIIDKNQNNLITRESQKDETPEEECEKFTITYIVNSPGGRVSSVMGFVDYIRMVKKKYSNVEFVSIATGLIASAGTIMCIVADKRKMTKNAFAMIHELSSSSGYNNYTRLKTHSEFITKLHTALVNIYLEGIGKDPNNKKHVEELEYKLLIETWLTAQEYQSMGFVDDIM
jgi:ATP-dependent protease ClpP protease subunit